MGSQSNDIPPTEKRPKVSVLMITYNHEKYIEQAVRSVMMQETDFDYELVIGEDCSTDSTREIVLQLKEEFPDKIKLLLHEKNVGMIPNMVATYNACTGEYIALCEGDDYWTHPKKLQLQVDFLENSPEFVMCFHPVWTSSKPDECTDIYEGGNPSQRDYSLADLFDIRQLMPTCSVVFKNIMTIPKWYHDCKLGDFPLFALILKHGKAKKLNSVMGVYRKHIGGVWSGIDSIQRQRINLDTLNIVNLEFDYNFSDRLKLSNKYIALARTYVKIHDYKNARSFFVRGLTHQHGGKLKITEVLKAFFLIYIPYSSKLLERIHQLKGTLEIYRREVTLYF